VRGCVPVKGAQRGAAEETPIAALVLVQSELARLLAAAGFLPYRERLRPAELCHVGLKSEVKTKINSTILNNYEM
jgi:hypothetical protein